MATTVILSDLIVGTPTLVRFSDGTELEFSALEDLNMWVDETDDPALMGEDLARRMCVAYLRKRSADYSNLNSVQGKEFIFDLAHGQPVRIR